MKRWILLAAVLSGCATTNDNPQDPFEPFNRGVYRFNDAVDKAVIKPVAQGYDKVVPQPVQTGVANFFSNLGDVIVVINDFMQLKVAQGVSDAGRFMINSTIGILGFIDVGSDIGLPKHNEDFGQTMGYWGMDTGPYIVLPLFGPSDARDTAGLVVDIVTYPVYYVNDSAVRAALYGTDTVSARDQLLQSEKVLDTAALDQYQFVRDAYLQRRRSLVHDGNPPKEDFDEGVEDESVEDEGVEDENVEDEGVVEGKRAPMPDSATRTVEQKSTVVSRNFVVFSQGSEGRPPRVWLPRIPRSVAE